VNGMGAATVGITVETIIQPNLAQPSPAKPSPAQLSLASQQAVLTMAWRPVSTSPLTIGFVGTDVDLQLLKLRQGHFQQLHCLPMVIELCDKQNDMTMVTRIMMTAACDNMSKHDNPPARESGRPVS